MAIVDGEVTVTVEGETRDVKAGAVNRDQSRSSVQPLSRRTA